MNVTIDCSQIHSRESLHRTFSKALSFPDWYGNNLDALHDCLSGMTGTIRLENWEEAESALGKYGTAAKKAIVRAGFENKELDIIL